MTVIECCCVFLTVALVGGVAAVMQRVQVRNEVERYWLTREKRRDENSEEHGPEMPAEPTGRTKTEPPAPDPNVKSTSGV